MRFMPKEETNLPGGQGRYNYAADPRFNGAKEREERLAEERRMGMNASDAALAEDIKMAEFYWKSEIAKAVASGTTHSQREQVQKVADQTPGGAAKQAKAAQAEAARLRRARELVRS
jgi:type IV secretory pathway TrbL component